MNIYISKLRTNVKKPFIFYTEIVIITHNREATEGLKL